MATTRTYHLHGFSSHLTPARHQLAHLPPHPPRLYITVLHTLLLHSLMVTVPWGGNLRPVRQHSDTVPLQSSAINNQQQLSTATTHTPDYPCVNSHAPSSPVHTPADCDKGRSLVPANGVSHDTFNGRSNHCHRAIYHCTSCTIHRAQHIVQLTVHRAQHLAYSTSRNSLRSTHHTQRLGTLHNDSAPDITPRHSTQRLDIRHHASAFVLPHLDTHHKATHRFAPPRLIASVSLSPQHHVSTPVSTHRISPPQFLYHCSHIG